MRVRGATRLSAALALALAVTVAAPAMGAATGTDGGVTVLHETFVDESRPSPASDLLPAETTRTLETTIAVPDGPRRPRPLVLLAHGASGSPNKFTQLIDAWARAGFVVVAPLFPRTSDTGGNLVGDFVEQPADLSFVLDEVLRMSRARRSPLRGRIDPEHVGLAGLSLGGLTTYGTVFHPCCRDERIDAAILMSAVLGSFPGGEYEFHSVPTMLVHGDADPLYPQSTDAYPRLVAPKWFVTIHGGTHAGPFEDAPEASDELVREITTDFWDRYLKGDRAAARAIVRAVEDSNGLATLQREL